jgi:hypothetical protein
MVTYANSNRQIPVPAARLHSLPAVKRHLRNHWCNYNRKKTGYDDGGIAHTAYGGVGLGYLLDFEPIIGALAFSAVSAVGIGYINRKGRVRSDVIIGLLWSFGMACEYSLSA